MWATPDESREQIVDLYQQACRHSDATIDELDLDATASIAQWPESRRQVTLHQILVQVIAETHRHAGHADIPRQLIDGAAGLLEQTDNLPAVDRSWWEGYRDRLEQAAWRASRRT